VAASVGSARTRAISCVLSAPGLFIAVLALIAAVSALTGIAITGEA